MHTVFLKVTLGQRGMAPNQSAMAALEGAVATKPDPPPLQGKAKQSAWGETFRETVAWHTYPQGAPSNPALTLSQVPGSGSLHSAEHLSFPFQGAPPKRLTPSSLMPSLAPYAPTLWLAPSPAESLPCAPSPASPHCAPSLESAYTRHSTSLCTPPPPSHPNHPTCHHTLGHPTFTSAIALLSLLACLAPPGALSIPLPDLFSTSLTRPADLLPVLPHPYNLHALNLLGNPADILPMYVGALKPGEQIRWRGTCFRENVAYVNLTEPKEDGKLGGAAISLVTSSPHSYTCIDIYLFATPYHLLWDWYFLARHHTETIDHWHKGERDLVEERGISVFLMPAGTLGTLRALWDVFPLFSNSGLGEAANVAFLQRHMGARFVLRTPPFAPAGMRLEDIHSGDLLVLSKIRGRWGGFESLEKWVTGAYGGHTAMAIRDEEGELWVAEAGVEDEKGAEKIGLRRWDEWWAFQQHDDADPQIALLPLKEGVRAKFNRSAAWSYASNMQGHPYGYHNMIFSWVDLERGNYPYPMDAHVVAAFIAVWERMQPAYAANIWNEALNMRLGTTGLDLPAIISECVRRRLRFGALLAIPEQDRWRYSDGPSVTCIVLALEMYKHGGLFGEMVDQIQVTEFHVRDAYMLNFFEDDVTQLPDWCTHSNEPPLPYCQLLGKYRLELPGYSTVAPYPHMNERCPSEAPYYIRPDGC